MSNIIETLEKEQMQDKKIPQFAAGDTVARTSCTDFAKRLIEADDAGVADAFVGVAGHDHAADIPQLPSNPDPCSSLVVILYSHMCPNYRQYYWHL